MKRFHVHVTVADVSASIRFYSTLFSAEPTVVKSDYAKWMLEDPRVNFAISKRGDDVGVRHLGIQVESEVRVARRLRAPRARRAPGSGRGKTTCCYAKSEKSWMEDPQGVQWEIVPHDRGEHGLWQ